MTVPFAGSYDGSSFFDFLRYDFPHLLPFQHLPQLPAGEVNLAELCRLQRRSWHSATMKGSSWRETVRPQKGLKSPHGVLRRSIMLDEYSVIAVAGAAGPCLEMVRLFQIEMEHYQKIEGDILALEGKANKLAQMVKQNLPAAFQGLVVVPIFAGYDFLTQRGRIFKYDVTGGRYEE